MRRVAETSSLTETQLECLALYRRVLSRDLTLAEAAKMRQPKPTKIGAFYHTVQQGRDNMREAVMTLTAGIWLGYVKLEDLRRLFDMVANTPSAFDNERAEQLLPVLEALVAKIVP